MVAALKAQDMTPDPFQTAKTLHQQGRLPEAEAAYRQALTQRPDDPAVLHLFAALLDQRGDARTARALLERALEIRPDLVSARLNLAKLLRRQGALEESAAAYRVVIAQRPGDLDARLDLAGILLRQLRLAEAVAVYRELLALAPRDARALNNIAVALITAGDLRGAEPYLRQALEIDPNDRHALNNLGNVLIEGERAEEAEATYRRAVELDPSDAQVRANLANALEKLGDARAAKATYRQCIGGTGNDGVRIRLATSFPAIPQTVAEIDEARREAFATLDELETLPLKVTDPFREVGSTPFYLAYQGHGDRDYQERLARLHARACPSLLDRAPHCRLGQRRRSGARLRIGFVSTFLRTHTIGRLNRNLIAGLDRRRFEVTVFAIAKAADPIGREIQAAADHVVVLPAGLEPARKAIAEAELDVLYFTDIGMVPLTYFLAFARLAPLQVTTWGHPITTGIPNVDRFLSMDLAEPADAQTQYSETLVRLPGLTTCYTRPDRPVRIDRAAFGFAPDRTIYLCPQSLFKLHPTYDAILGAILAGDPKAEVALLAGGQRRWTELLTQRFARTLPNEAMARIRFVPRVAPDDFLALLAAADVILDPTIFCGGNTTLESLAMGTPVVTLPSPYLRGRLTLAMYRRMEFLDLVAQDADDYARIALALGTDRDRREAAKRKIAERAPVLFGDTGAIRAQERLFEELATARAT